MTAKVAKGLAPEIEIVGIALELVIGVNIRASQAGHACCQCIPGMQGFDRQ